MVRKQTTTEDAPQLRFSTRHFGTANVVTSTYEDSGKMAVELVDDDGESIAVLSVNIPTSISMLGEKEFFARTWSENEEIAEDALASGIFRDTGRTSDGFLKAKIWTLIMPFKKSDPEKHADSVQRDSDPSAEEISELRGTLDKTEEKVDVLEDLLDMVNER